MDGNKAKAIIKGNQQEAVITIITRGNLAPTTSES